MMFKIKCNEITHCFQTDNKQFEWEYSRKSFSILSHEASPTYTHIHFILFKCHYYYSETRNIFIKTFITILEYLLFFLFRLVSCQPLFGPPTLNVSIHSHTSQVANACEYLNIQIFAYVHYKY